MRTLCLLALLVPFAVSCTAGPPPDDASKANPAETKEADPAADQQRADFMAQCARSEEQKPFCECSFDVAKKTLTPEELGQVELKPERAQLLQQGIGRECADKVPIAKVREGFMQECSRPGKEMVPFCECTWDAIAQAGKEAITQMRQSDPRIGQAAKSCAEKIPETVVKDLFFKGCVSTPDAAKFCDCAWKTLRKEFDLDHIVLGGRDWAKPALPKVRAECGKLAPKGSAQ
jgi:hypothetical protein